eukprot:PRCOL_00002423-RA
MPSGPHAATATAARGGSAARQAAGGLVRRSAPAAARHRIDIKKATFPAYADYAAFTLEPPPSDEELAELFACQLGVAVGGEGGEDDQARAFAVQQAGALDDACAYDGPLGCTVSHGEASLAVWAPTAQRVRAIVFDTPDPHAGPALEIEMARGPRGEWTTPQGAVPADLIGRGYYVYEVTVYCPWTDYVEVSVASDPYSHGLSADGARTHLVDIGADAACFPGEGGAQAFNARWAARGQVTPREPTDFAIYELHVRDFSASDMTVEPELRGGYRAFACEHSRGRAHLRELARAGMTHIHLLPVPDYGSVNERKHEWATARPPPGVGSLRELSPDSDAQQQAVVEAADRAPYNWGYDPHHYSAPEGSYASDPDGPARVRELRELVEALADDGLGTVLDVVYNHTCSSGPHCPKSVLDKVVPGYYQRRNMDGHIEASTCMNNTASEHYMFERLVVDSVVHWVRQYRVAGFRFDLMGHMMLSTIQRTRAALDALTLERDGIDGSAVYLYGEGWDFGEVANGRLGVNASQSNLAGTGVGSFNDRLREAVVGGSPFGDPRVQGFATAVLDAPNGFEMDDAERLRIMRDSAERLQCALAGNLAEFEFDAPTWIEGGALGPARRVLGRDAAGWGGYAGEPRETVNYVSAHDNETLFDMCVWKLRGAGCGAEELARHSLFASSTVAYAQGVPFFHAGDDILRSKSLDRDSYRSGDHFNRLDWEMRDNNYGVGLPPAPKNGEKYDLMRPLLVAADEISPSHELIARTAEAFREMLRVRNSSPLFRLRSAADIQERVLFAPDAPPGMVVMVLRDGGADGADPKLAQLDAALGAIVVIFNGTTKRASYHDGSDWLFNATAGLPVALHEIQAASVDPSTAASTWMTEQGPTVDPATAAVFVLPRGYS